MKTSSTQKRTRALGQSQAKRCEEAVMDGCRCRCGGQFHGAMRGRVTDLPESDPHRPALSCIARRDDGRLCRRKVVVQDERRGGMVCARHAPLSEVA